jgi:hypothetical protein
MIKIIRGAEVDGPKGEAGARRHGTWAYSATGYPLVCGYSRLPLLDCLPAVKIALRAYRTACRPIPRGQGHPDISCGIDVGAATTVREPANGAIGFSKYVAFSNVFGAEPAAAQG